MFRHFNRGHALVGSATVALAVLLPAGIASAAPGKVSGANSSTLPANCSLPFPFRPGNFDRPTRIDNKYLPLVPGTQFVYQGDVTAGPGTQPHTIVFTVTDLTKVIDGVTNRVVHDVDLDNGVVQEAELSLWAQDDDGNVWNLAEYPEEYDNGKFSGAPSVWATGIDRAQGGIQMLADPKKHLNEIYLQGRAPAIDFLDCAQVAATGGKVDVPAGHFNNVLTTHEFSPLESRTAIQTKDYAPHVGNVRIGALNDPEAETLSLTQFKQLSDRQLAAIDEQARALDRHGRQISPVWKQTPPVQQGGDDSHGRGGEHNG